MVSTDPYEIFRKNLASASEDSEEFRESQEADEFDKGGPYAD